MKKVIALVVAMLFVLSVAGLSFAAEKAATAAPAADKKEAAPAKAEKKAPAKVKQVTGEVVAVDAKAKTLTVKGKKADVVLSVDDKAAAKLADVKVGDKVTVKYKETDGKNVATSVVAKKAKADKKAEKKMEKKEAAPAAPAPAAKPADKK